MDARGGLTLKKIYKCYSLFVQIKEGMPCEGIMGEKYLNSVVTGFKVSY